MLDLSEQENHFCLLHGAFPHSVFNVAFEINTYAQLCELYLGVQNNIHQTIFLYKNMKMIQNGHQKQQMICHFGMSILIFQNNFLATTDFFSDRKLGNALTNQLLTFSNFKYSWHMGERSMVSF